MDAQVPIGKIPIMLRSQYCQLHEFSDSDLLLGSAKRLEVSLELLQRSRSLLMQHFLRLCNERMLRPRLSGVEGRGGERSLVERESHLLPSRRRFLTRLPALLCGLPC